MATGSAHKELLAEAAQACESMIVESGKKLKVADKVRLRPVGSRIDMSGKVAWWEEGDMSGS